MYIYTECVLEDRRKDGCKDTGKDSSKDTNVSLLGIISQFVALIDLCYVKAYNATKYNYCKPTIYDCDCGLREDGAKSYVNFKTSKL